MSETIFLGVAWPYANGPIHVGQLAGCYLPADIFARFHRLKGNQVLMVSGSDQHGTPITVKAETEGVSPAEVVARYHALFLETWQKIGISFDLFTTTGTENHREVVHRIFRKLLDQGDLYLRTENGIYDPIARRFLPDRYVEGTCPYCHYPRARGDQCENCGRQLEPTQLIEMRSVLSKGTPEIRPTEHFFFRLSKYNAPLLEWVRQQEHWRPNVRNFTLRYLEEGLIDRAITRDIEWGVPVPVPGFEQKRIYVWFEAVIGYLSASVEWAARQGDPERWRQWWSEGAKSYYFIGKDNIPFHTMIWPAMLMAYGGLVLPYDVPANEFMNLERRKISTSQNWAVWVLDVLERYDPDQLRYYVASVLPETTDSDFSWYDFWRRNNDELVATYGNLVHRVLTFTVRHWSGAVPEPGPLTTADEALFRRVEEAFAAVDAAITAVRLRDGLREAMALAQEVNRYLDEQAPWTTVRDDRVAAGRALFVALQAINALKVLLAPYLPFSSARLHRMLGFTAPFEAEGFRPARVPAGQLLGEPVPLFRKLDEAIVAAEQARLGAAHAG
ncbi:MAG: methionine--tRNA ligase [Chloroflexi bacterium]|nr:methionine--tRNA ligase [Chloroflexota bacterium]GIW12508.1 MAG: methionine--tRNA ligase [Dehalococcoidia bacterium]